MIDTLEIASRKELRAASTPSVTVPPRRVDLYPGIHKGLRMWMADVLGQAGRVDPTDETEITALAASVRALLAGCAKHLDSENHFVHTAMEQAIPGAARNIEAEHVAHLREIALIERAVDGLQSARAELRPAAAERLYRLLGRFVAENFEHMNVEETEHNAVLWACYSDPELMEIEGTIIASVPPELMAQYLRWMIPAMSAPERAALFTGLRRGAPAEVVKAMLGVVKPHLSNRDWTKLMAAMGPMSGA